MLIAVVKVHRSTVWVMEGGFAHPLVVLAGLVGTLTTTTTDLHAQRREAVGQGST